jgi:hypothetical protein
MKILKEPLSLKKIFFLVCFWSVISLYVVLLTIVLILAISKIIPA